MRPVHIELEGFSAYRSREEVDFRRLAGSDVAFFSLTGATGSGKSSLVDAIIFALYGRIPRLGGRAVAPVISAGVDRARVRLDFEVDGEVYTAVRLAQRTAGGGATVKEARLQRGDQVLFDGADNVTRAVEGILHLGFDDFTRTVVLPQGEFARFLNATAGERQSLLRGLLGLDVYGKVRQLATNRQSAEEARVESARARLDRMEVPTSEVIDALQSRLTDLESMDAETGEAESRLLVLEKERESAQAEVARLAGSVTRLEGLRPPQRLEELAGLVSASLERHREAEDALRTATGELKKLEAVLEELPAPEMIARHLSDYQALDEAEAGIAALDVENARAVLATAESALEEARQELAGLREDRDALRLSHSAHALAETLISEEPCPVCRQQVKSLPDLEPIAEITELDERLEVAGTGVIEAEAVVMAAQAEATGVETTHADLSARIEQFEGKLAGLPGREELVAQEARHAAIKEALATTRARVEATVSAMEKAGREYEDLTSDQRQMAKLLRAEHQKVADLEPPISESDDVVVEWKELLAWRDDTLSRMVDGHALAVGSAAAVIARIEEIRSALAHRLSEVGVTANESFRSALAADIERARASLVAHRRDLEEVGVLTVEIETGTAAAAVARSLANQLKVGRFEQWIMAGALETLVTGANGLLAELSDRGYSLCSEEGAFSIVDHRNADEIRPVSTLSGGETFLVSLALALSLAEIHAAEGDARLETVILDEGFGSLDDETLDTVASVLEELARNRGLMVGVITHVKELAERATVRFEVTRGPKGALVVELA